MEGSSGVFADMEPSYDAAKERPSIICVADPLPFTGGGLRTLRSLKEYSKHFKTHLFLPYSLSRRGVREAIKELAGYNIRIAGYNYYPNLIHRVRVLGEIVLYLFPATMRPHIGIDDFYAVVVLHEIFEAIYTGSIIGNLLGIPKIGLLQLPPFYSSKKRLHNILRAIILWRHLLAGNPLTGKLLELEGLARFNTTYKLGATRIRKLLEEYSTLIAVSKSIPYEMGSEWTSRVISLDPGVSLDESDLNAMVTIKSRSVKKGSYVVFGGRPSAEKGLAEALVAFSLISRHCRDLKLVVTGHVRKNTLLGLKRACKKLRVEDKVVFTGFLPRWRRFEIIAKARLMLYPSHVDSFSYAVFESLHLGTPVVGYRIPALETYYSRQPGVKLVEEGDLEALTVEAVNILEKGIEAVEPPEIKSWREIMEDEVAIIKRAIGV